MTPPADDTALAASSTPALPFVGHMWTMWPNCATGRGTVGGSTSDGSSLLSGPFVPGEEVAIDMKSNSKHCHAVVVGDHSEGDICSASTSVERAPADVVDGPPSVDELQAAVLRKISTQCASPPMKALSSVQKVRLLEDGSIVGVPLHRLTRVLPPHSQRVVLVSDTINFRRLAKTQVGRNDSVLEVGSSLGECTHVLHAHGGMVVGIDVVSELIEESRRRHPQCRFEWLDCFEEPERLRRLCDELSTHGSLKLFVDVGGDRMSADVCRVLAALGVAARASLVVVKAQSLVSAAAAVPRDDHGNILNLHEWWQRAAAPPPPGSAAQMKKKLARARKAKWNSADSEAWDTFNSFRSKWDVPPEEYELLCAEARKKKEENKDKAFWGDDFRSLLGIP